MGALQASVASAVHTDLGFLLKLSRLEGENGQLPDPATALGSAPDHHRVLSVRVGDAK